MPSLGSKVLGAFLLVFGAMYLMFVTPPAIKRSADYAKRATAVEALVVRNQWADTSDGSCSHWFRYEFEYDGIRDTGRRVTRPDVRNTCEEIRAAMAAYPVGSRIRAYRLSGDTTVRAYLRNPRELQDPLILALPLTLIAVAFGGGLLLPGYLEPKARARRAGRWYVLRGMGAIGLHAQTWTAGIVAFWVGWGVSLALDAAHWGFDAGVFLDSLGVLTLAAGVTVTAFAYFRLHKFVDDPIVATDRWPLVRGQPVSLRVSIPMKRRVQLEYTSVGIACRMKDTKHRPQPDESTIFNVPLGAVDTPTVDDVMHRFETTMTVPALTDRTTTWPYTWFVVVHIDPDGAPGQDLDYPIEVV